MQLIQEGNGVAGFLSPCQHAEKHSWVLCLTHPSCCWRARAFYGNVAQPLWQRPPQCCHVPANTFRLSLRDPSNPITSIFPTMQPQVQGFKLLFVLIASFKKNPKSFFSLLALLKESIKDALPSWMAVWIKQWAGHKLCGLVRIQPYGTKRVWGCGMLHWFVSFLRREKMCMFGRLRLGIISVEMSVPVVGLFSLLR